MAFTKFLFVVTLITIASAGFVWEDDDDLFPGFSDAFKMPEIPEIKSLEFDDIKTHVAGDNEQYTGESKSSYSSSSTVNGKTVSSGGVSELTNDGKAVEEKVMEYKDGD
ncbi:uncharacterized protein LOC114244870 [Bombyx mandarina]|uniref:Uncharacterized protein LOC114244870 n=1 Tax=Bombyx mandarina TaxID=7092 RepID=A0A6J2JTL3_BOMMA|nr:uncharacterized protein LOC114244870 [Bombyx mandarina]